MKEHRLGGGALNDLEDRQSKRNDELLTIDQPTSSRSTAAFPIRLNARWRVEFHRAQWVLSCLFNYRWRPRSFCVSRQGLLQCIREHSGQITPEALGNVQRLPEWHPDRTGGQP